MAKVLLVTDDPAGYRTSAWALQEDGHEVWIAGSDFALKLVAENRPDVIVFDTTLPTQVQNHRIQEMRSLAPSARVVDLVHLRGEPTRSSDQFLREPYTPEELSAKVASLLEG